MFDFFIFICKNVPQFVIVIYYLLAVLSGFWKFDTEITNCNLLLLIYTLKEKS